MSFAIKKRLEKKDQNPNILLVDGGKAQLNSIIAEVKGKDILLLAIAKGFKRKAMTETIYSIDGQLEIDINSKLFKLLSKARDEAHRFALKAHRKSKQKQVNYSILDEVKGIGAVKKNILLSKFGSIQNIKNLIKENY